MAMLCLLFKGDEMKKILVFFPIIIFAGLNNSYTYQKGFREGVILKQQSFGKIFSQKEINNKCLEIYKRDSLKDNDVKFHKDTFLKGCKEALEPTF